MYYMSVKHVKYMLRNDLETKEPKMAEHDIFALVTEKNLGGIVIANNRGADLNSHDMFGKTPLILAIEQDSFEIVDILVASGADPNQKSIDEKSPLGIALERGNNKIVGHLIAKGAEGGAELLQSAVEQNNSELLDMLLEKGADVNSKNQEGMTALLVACQRENLVLVEHLLKKNADANVKDNSGFNPLSLAMKQENYKMFDMLVEYGADIYQKNDQGQNLLMQAIIEDNPKLFENLLTKEFNLQDRDSNGKTALYYAVKTLDKDFVLDLLDAGADVNEAYENESVVDVAMSLEAHKIVDIIIERGGTIRNFDSIAAINRIVEASKAERFPFEKNRDFIMMNNLESIDFGKLDENGNSSLHLVVKNYNKRLEPILEFVLKRGAEVNAADKRGATALHYAILDGNSPIARKLMTYGANINHKDSNGVSPYSLTQMLANLKAIEEPLENIEEVVKKTRIKKKATKKATRSK